MPTYYRRVYGPVIHHHPIRWFPEWSSTLIAFSLQTPSHPLHTSQPTHHGEKNVQQLEELTFCACYESLLFPFVASLFDVVFIPLVSFCCFSGCFSLFSYSAVRFIIDPFECDAVAFRMWICHENSHMCRHVRWFAFFFLRHHARCELFLSLTILCKRTNTSSHVIFTFYALKIWLLLAMLGNLQSCQMSSLFGKPQRKTKAHLFH